MSSHCRIFLNASLNLFQRIDESLNQWLRAVVLALGIYELLIHPDGFARLAWVTEIPEATVKKAHMLRFQAAALRNGNTSWTAPLDLEFGLLYAGCKLSPPETVSILPDTITLRYPSETKFDGWYMVTGKVRGASECPLSCNT